MASRKTSEIAEFGDFQTPDELAAQVVSLVHRLGVQPATVVEPSCGRGAFVAAAADEFPEAQIVGVDINEAYISICRDRVQTRGNVSLSVGSFFDQDWVTLLSDLPNPLLILGNPPWVTNAELGLLGSSNLPVKSNFGKHKGLDAITGKANFDISEWMLLRNLEWLEKKGGTLAVLVKTAVARKILAHAWKSSFPIKEARIYRIDALSSFGAAVDACLFYIAVQLGTRTQECSVFEDLESDEPSATFGFADGKVISDMDAYRAHRYLYGVNPEFSWRSGIKHDCAKVMEFTRVDGALTNGHGEVVDIEDTYLYPLFKSSDIGGVKQVRREKYVLVTQKFIGQETDSIAEKAPKTWSYLLEHSAALDRRTSVIYKNKAKFSIFGVGEYSFAPWKIAISGLYKNLKFKIFGPIEGKPACFDDTVYFLPFDTEGEAKAVLELLERPAAQEFLSSMIFWDEKRPITVDVLKRLDVNKLISSGGAEHMLAHRKGRGTAQMAMSL